jgi:ribosome maturation factor RimP
MSDLNQKIKGWIDDYVGQGPIFLVDLLVTQGARRTLISILLDTEEGVTIEECALLSRKLGHHMEENEWIEEAYNLEVSSPGLDYPLTQGWQFKKNIGRQIKVWLVGEDPVIGILQGYTDVAVEILIEKMVKHKKVVAKESSWIQLAVVDKIKVQVTFQ